MFLKYLRFVFVNVFRSIFVYITWALYFMVLMFLVFILPIILDMSLSLITKYQYLFILLIMIAIINISSFSYSIFRKPIDDGTELLIISKPITRSELIWAKILFYFVVTILTAALTSIICYITKYSSYSNETIASELATNSFIGTIIIYSFFGGLCTIFAIFFKQIGSILVSVSFYTILMIYTFVTSQIFMSIPKYLKQNEGINLGAIALVEIDASNSYLYSHWGANGAINSSKNFITSDFYESQNFNISSNEFLSTKYNDVVRKTNFEAYLWTNIVHQLSSIYTWPSNDYFTQSYAYYESAFRSSTSANIKINFDTNSLNNQNLLYLSYLNEKYYLANNLNSNSIDANGNVYYNGYNSNNMITKIDSYLDSKKLPMINANNTIEYKQFDLKNLDDFVSIYYDQKVTNLINAINLISPIKFNVMSFWLSIFNCINMQKLIDNSNGSINLTNFYNYKNINDILSESAEQIQNFQQLSFFALQNSSNYIEVQNQQLFLSLNELSTSFNASNSRIVSICYPYNELSSLNATNIKKYLISYQPFFYIVNENKLPTFNFITISTFYDYYGLISLWLSLGLLSFFIGALLFFKYNFS